MENFEQRVQAPRTKVMKLLDGISDRRLIYIHAPAGYGKTVSAQLWIERKEVGNTRHAWIALDEYDNKSANFCGRFVSALLAVQPANERLRELAGHSSFDVAPDEFTIRTLSAFEDDGQKYILVIDDLHVIKDERVLKLLPAFYKRLPESCSIVLLSRNAPPDIFADLMLKDALAIVDAEALRFDSTEIKKFFDSGGRHITKEQAEAIYMSTGGWAIGLRALLFSGTDSYAMELTGQYLEVFLKEHVWEKWDKKTREYMMKTSVAEELTIGLANALTGKKDSGAMLAALARENVFLRPTGDGIYRFHDLFRDFLMHMLEDEGPDIKGGQMRRAGDWFYKSKDYYRAVEYYLRCGDTDGISKGLKFMYNYNSPYASVEDTAAIIRLSVNDDIVGKHSFLLEALGWAAFVEGRGDEMERYLDRYFKQLSKVILQNPISVYVAVLLRCMDYRNSMADFSKHVAKVPKKLLAVAPAPSISQNMPLFHRSGRDFSEFSIDTEKKLMSLQKLFDAMFGKEANMLRDIFHAGFAYERGELGKAHEFAIAASTKLKEGFAPELQFCAFMALAAILDAQGERADALKALDGAEAMIERHNAYYLYANFRAYQYRMRLSEGDMAAARIWLKDYAGSPYEHMAFYKLYRHFTTARAYIVTKDYNTAILFLKKMLELSEHYRRPLDIMESCILLAIAYWKKGGGGQGLAIEFLERAACQAYEYGYTQLFVNEGADLANMLHRLQKRMVQSDYKGDVTSAFVKSLYVSAVAVKDRFKGLSGGRAPENLTFTDKQKTVMRLMCEGHSRKEIAEKMGLKPYGVKSHVELIYRKLDVPGSIEAIVKIKEMGLEQ